MSRIAVWRLRPEDPRRPWDWILRGDGHITPAQRRSLRIAVPFAILGILLLTWSLDVAGLFLGTLIACVGYALYFRPGAREHAAIMDSAGEAFPVVVNLRQGHRSVGTERGWVAFVDGWLVYEGLRTSFSFRAADTTAQFHLGGKVHIALLDGGRIRMGLLTDGMQTNRPARARDLEAFLLAFDEWKFRASPPGEPLLPPQAESHACLGRQVSNCSLVATTFQAVVVCLAAVGEWGWIALPQAVAILCVYGALASLRRLRRTLGLSSEDKPRAPSLSPENERDRCLETGSDVAS